MADDPSENSVSAEGALRALRPEHCVVGDKLLRRVVRLPGRQRKVRPAPDADGRAYAARVAQIAEQFVADDPVVQAAGVERAREDHRVYDEALIGVAREAASLAFEKRRLLGEGKDIAQVCSRRIEALSKMASLVIERARLGAEDPFDPRSPKVQKVVALFLEQMKECAHEALPAEVAEKFLANFEARAEGWEKRVEA